MNGSDLYIKQVKNNPFEIERLRDLLAKKELFNELKKTYKKDFAEIKDLNSSLFWNEIFLHKNKTLEIDGPMARDRINSVVKMLKNKKGKMLDIGFGLSLIEKRLSQLRENKISFHGIEISDFAIEKANKILNGKFLKGSILKIPFSKDYFDIVLCLEVLEHIPSSKIFNAFNEISRVIKKNGLIIISVPLNENLEDLLKRKLNPNGHVRIYTPDLISAELKINSFKILKREYLYAFSNLYRIKKILSKIFVKKWEPNNLILVAEKK